MVHSATGGSSADLQGYFSRETHNTAEIDDSLIHRHDFQSIHTRDEELKRYVGEEEVKLLDEQEKSALAELTSFMGLGFIVRAYSNCVTLFFAVDRL